MLKVEPVIFFESLWISCRKRCGTTGKARTGQGVWAVVSGLAFYLGNTSSNPSEVLLFIREIERKKKKGVGQY